MPFYVAANKMWLVAAKCLLKLKVQVQVKLKQNYRICGIILINTKKSFHLSLFFLKYVGYSERPIRKC